MPKNEEFILKKYVGKGNYPGPEHFGVKECNYPETLGNNEILVETYYLSVDPYMRNRMNKEGGSYAKPYKEGVALTSCGCGRVIASTSSKYKVGDVITTRQKLEYPFRRYLHLTEAQASIFPICKSDVPPELYSATIGALGMPGLTAYFGMLDIGKPRAGETVLVSGAAGCTGATAGQIAKIKGCKVFGTAGSEEKCKFLVEELGFDGALNYKGKNQEQLQEAIKALCPNGIDVYYDNVGGIMSEAAIKLMNKNGRIPVCGSISQYNTDNPQGELSAEGRSLVQSQSITRKWFLVSDYMIQQEGAFKQLLGWAKAGKLKCPETYFEGLESLTPAFLALFQGKNTGKVVVKLEALANPTIPAAVEEKVEEKEQEESTNTEETSPQIPIPETTPPPLPRVEPPQFTVNATPPPPPKQDKGICAWNFCSVFK